MNDPVAEPAPMDAQPDAARAARKRWEAEKIAAARRQVAAGQFMTGDELDRWLDLSDMTDKAVPVPRRAPNSKFG